MIEARVQRSSNIFLCYTNKWETDACAKAAAFAVTFLSTCKLPPLEVNDYSTVFDGHHGAMGVETYLSSVAFYSRSCLCLGGSMPGERNWSRQTANATTTSGRRGSGGTRLASSSSHC